MIFSLKIHPLRIARSLTLAALIRVISSPLAPDGLTRKTLNLMKVQYEPNSKHKYSGGARAACCISTDFDHLTHLEPKIWKPVPSQERLSLNHKGTERLVELCLKYRIPITWAVCGKTAEADPLSYQKVRDSDVQHEIAVHTYSHLDVSLCTEEELEAEISKCVDVLKLEKIPQIFVFPWNRMGHFETLRKMGFLAYRSNERKIGVPSKKEGLWEISPVYYLDENAIGNYTKIKRYVDICIAHGAVFHLWSHPWSIVAPGQGQSTTVLKETLEPLFDYLSRKRSEGILSVTTMGGLAQTLDNELRI